MINRSNYFAAGPQAPWNRKRLDLLYTILGPEWFPGKTILELGCGHGQIGKELIEKGAIVTRTDGRPDHVEALATVDGLPASVLDVDGEWSVSGEFDLIIFWGVLYHLKEWKKSLESALTHTPLITLETIVNSSSDPMCNEEVKEGEHYDQALHGIGTRPSAEHIEMFLTSLGATYERYDTNKINTEACANYTWNGDEKVDINWRRRFWMVRRAA